MHQYKTTVQLLLVLSILNLAFAAPISREVTGGTTSSSTTDVPPPHDPLPTEEPTPSHVSVPLSAGPDGQVPVPSTEPLTPAHPATDATRPVPVQDLTSEGSTTAHDTTVLAHVEQEQMTTSPGLLNAEVIKKSALFVGYLAVVAGASAGVVKFSEWVKNKVGWR